MTTALNDDVSAQLLNLIQEQIPLTERPVEALGRALSLSEADVIARLTDLKSGKPAVIRQICGIFDSRSIGYQSSLVAAKVDEAHIDAAAAAINAHPGVSHNYRRNHAYNLWYTVTVPPDSTLGLQGTVDALHRLSGAATTRLMPALKMYKIGVKFDVSGEADLTARSASKAAKPAWGAGEGNELTAADRQMIRVVQQDLPIVARPFDEWAREAGVSVESLLSAARSYAERGLMRRFSAVLRHRAAGFGANAMGAWVVPPELQDAFGETAATFSAVSHCYLRPTYEDWPYSLFTMVHAPTKEQCEQVLRLISEATGVTEYAALYSSVEYKKVRVRYFTDDIARWEQAVGPAPTRTG